MVEAGKDQVAVLGSLWNYNQIKIRIISGFSKGLFHHINT